ncbi:MAG: hypothetical protein R3F20_04305 [Planctomycetota bacterium]
MRSRFTPLLVVLASSAFAVGGFAQDEAGPSASLQYKSYKKWEIILPNETFTPVAGAIKLPHSEGEGFATEIDGTALAIDSNGDGKVDVKAKGASALVTLKAKTTEGNEFKYSLRLVNAGTWRWSAGGAMVGRLDGETIKLIDQNNNGRYDDFGVDAMIIGNGDAASFLSKIVSVNGKLYNLSVSSDGSSVTTTPYVGETGRLDLASGFETKGKLLSAIVRGNDDAVSFDLAGASKGMLVPVGEYRLVSGYAAKGSESVRIKGGDRRMKVGIDSDFSLEWGGPIQAEFTYTREGDKVTFDPAKVKYVGRAGETYVDWVPDATSPQFLVYKKDSRKKIAEARFGGC